MKMVGIASISNTARRSKSWLRQGVISCAGVSFFLEDNYWTRAWFNYWSQSWAQSRQYSSLT